MGLHGTFHEWAQGDRDRRDERLGIRTTSTLRIGRRIWVRDDNGAVRELLGIEKRRQITEDFLSGSGLVKQPQYSKYAGAGRLPDGRNVYYLDVAPPGGEPYRVAIDAQRWLIVQTSYVDVDARSSSTLSDQRVIGGELVAFTETDSDGDTAYDVTTRVTSFDPNARAGDSVFAPLAADNVVAPAPVTVHYALIDGLMVVPVQIEGKTYQFLLDSGSQTDVIDPSLAQAFGLHAEGTIEVTGAKRTPGGGTVEMPAMSIGGLTLPMRIATVVDVSHTMRTIHLDGMIGYPLLAAADVAIDPSARTITIGSPGTLAHAGALLDVDTDRELCDVAVTVQHDPTHALFDTGDANELLIFQSFVEEYPGEFDMQGANSESGSGVGGSIRTRAVTVDDLKIGPYDLYKRRAVVVMSHQGAFADRNDGANVGFGVLQNFDLTFALTAHAIYLKPIAGFDDGRWRSQ